jgi:F-type H+-transporting ATPase subunit delta
VTNRATANRYARALFDVAVKMSDAELEGVEREVGEFVALIRQNPPLEAVMLNPAVPAPRKRTAMEALVSRAGLSPITSRLLVMLAERDRLVLLPDILDAYRQRLMDHQQVVRAEVTTAVELPAEQTARIERSLADATGRRVSMQTRVDPSIIGGVVARIGSTVYDASVMTQLKKVRERLADQGTPTARTLS